MDPVFIYFKEIDFTDDNKFTLDFSHENHIQETIFLENKGYYIVSSNCNFVVKEPNEHRKNLLKSFLKKVNCYFKKEQHIKMLLRMTSDFAPASSKVFLDIQATIECGYILKRVHDITRTHS